MLKTLVKSCPRLPKASSWIHRHDGLSRRLLARMWRPQTVHETRCRLLTPPKTRTTSRMISYQRLSAPTARCIGFLCIYCISCLICSDTVSYSVTQEEAPPHGARCDRR
ncbi:hypothetical protein C8R45DRAFT_1222183 [Mycena sanguinolenta]|nr:hypothetical protein C8R45DRAFT_1222183 [Mycena sanguinolenta]